MRESWCWTEFAIPSKTFFPVRFFLERGKVMEQVANLLQQKRGKVMEQVANLLQQKTPAKDSALSKAIYYDYF